MTKTLTTTEELKHLASSDNTNELTRSLARECLANREVQPVGFASDSYMCELKDSGVVHAWLRRDADDPGFSVKLYTAPPAPTVPVNPTLLIDYDKEMYFFGGRGASLRIGSKLSDEYREGLSDGYDACRAAMLAQPVSQGYKLVPVEPTEEMIAAAMNCDDVEFNSDETFCVNFDNIYRAMLAAAPEGSNG
ncbi:hypothetical protein [Serratia marcescens]|uniref:hypothetical protein n=1 Tax=Serratia marcescens TaxID=615 RepID=UPI003ED91208